MAKKDFLKTEGTEVNNIDIPEIPAIILEDDEMQLVFMGKPEAMLVALEYQRQHPTVTSCIVEEHISLKYGNYFKLIPVEGEKQAAVLPTERVLDINKKQKAIINFGSKEKI